MTRMCWTLALPLVAFLLNTVAAQPPEPPPPQPPLPPLITKPDPRLDAVLARWEQETAQVQTMALEVTCTCYNEVFNKTDTLVGYAKFLKQPNGEYLASVRLENPTSRSSYERYVCTGEAIYVFRPEEKLIYVYDDSVRKAKQFVDDGVLSFLFSLKADTAKRRYDMKIAQEPDEWYTYVEVLPGFPRDKADFVWARLAILNKSTPNLLKDLPREVHFVEPNQVKVTSNVSRMQRDVPGSVDRNDFVKPTLPPGWQWKTETKAAQLPATKGRP